MISNKDNDFLLWLAKRLVFKYGENKEILDIVNAIVTKNQMILDYYNTIEKNIESKLQESIKMSYDLIKDINANKSNLINAITQNKNALILSKFEDINIDEILKQR